MKVVRESLTRLRLSHVPYATYIFAALLFGIGILGGVLLWTKVVWSEDMPPGIKTQEKGASVIFGLLFSMLAVITLSLADDMRVVTFDHTSQMVMIEHRYSFGLQTDTKLFDLSQITKVECQSKEVDSDDAANFSRKYEYRLVLVFGRDQKAQLVNSGWSSEPRWKLAEPHRAICNFLDLPMPDESSLVEPKSRRNPLRSFASEPARTGLSYREREFNGEYDDDHNDAVMMD